MVSSFILISPFFKTCSFVATVGYEHRMRQCHQLLCADGEFWFVLKMLAVSARFCFRHQSNFVMLTDVFHIVLVVHT